MSSRIQKVVPKPVAALGVRIEEWRRNKGNQHRMPRELWKAAAQLAKRYGVGLVAESLSLGYTSLKRKAHGDWGSAKKESTKGGFVDITPPTIAATSMMSSTNEIELRRPDGNWVVIRNADSDCVTQVAGMFFEQGR